MHNIYRVCIVMAIALLTLTSWLTAPVLANTEQSQSSQTAQQKPYQSQQQTQFPQQERQGEQTSQTMKQSSPDAQTNQIQAKLAQRFKQLIDSFKG